VTSLLKASLCAGLATVALVGAAAQPARAAASGTPCWKVLLNDWYDGRIDGSYERHCYTEALKHLPADVSTYSSAHDDILRALQSAIAKQRQGGNKVGPNTVIKPATTGTKGGSSGTGTTTGTTGTQTGPDQPGGLANKLDPGSPSSLPVPLLILGGLALVLVAAGGAGLVAKRIQARRQSP
jgi:hypothetical protein